MRSNLAFPFVVGLIILTVVAASVIHRVRWPIYIVAAIGWTAMALWPAVIVASYYTATLSKRRSQLWLYLFGSLTVFAASVPIAVWTGGNRYLTTGTFPNVVLYFLGIVGMPMIIGLWLAARREVIAGLHERAERLEREQAAEAERARAAERTRIAREMHDVVAHRVALMVLHAGAIEVNTAEDRVISEAALIRNTGRDALRELREVLGILRSTDAEVVEKPRPLPMLADLDRLIDQSRSLGITIIRRDQGMARPLPAAVERTVYRLAQEALTNVHKHAAGADTVVVVRYSPTAVDLEISNRPPGQVPNPLPGSGYGLVGIRERVELLSGEFHAMPLSTGGYLVWARIPA